MICSTNYILKELKHAINDFNFTSPLSELKIYRHFVSLGLMDI